MKAGERAFEAVFVRPFGLRNRGSPWERCTLYLLGTVEPRGRKANAAHMGVWLGALMKEADGTLGSPYQFTRAYQLPKLEQCRFEVEVTL